ncbi:unnamed protein product [Amoebophrya sp. A25]|nr:unnamed protein product [Amoebophrya sp. A25]|eukprot:GSA25T00012795001.1
MVAGAGVSTAAGGRATSTAASLVYVFCASYGVVSFCTTLIQKIPSLSQALASLCRTNPYCNNVFYVADLGQRDLALFVTQFVCTFLCFALAHVCLSTSSTCSTGGNDQIQTTSRGLLYSNKNSTSSYFRDGTEDQHTIFKRNEGPDEGDCSEPSTQATESEFEGTRSRKSANGDGGVPAHEVADLSSTSPSSRPSSRVAQKLFMDGAFDLTHYGHFNALRIGKSLGNYLCVGVNSSESIEESKGFAPVLTDEERCIAIEGCRFVDEIIPQSPYVMTKEYMHDLVKTKQIDYFIHGSDPCIVDGEDVYKEARKMGRFKEIPRTTGISTTDMVGRMLLYGQTSSKKESKSSRKCGMSKSSRGGASSGPSSPDLDDDDCSQRSYSKMTAQQKSAATLASGEHPGEQRFYSTTAMLRAFSEHCRSPNAGEKVAYFPGSWDMFNATHILAMKQAKEALGCDYLLVGVYSDAVATEVDSEAPLLSFYERMLSVLGCKYTDDIIVPAPQAVTAKLLEEFKVSSVVVLDPEEPASASGTSTTPSTGGGSSSFVIRSQLEVEEDGGSVVLAEHLAKVPKERLHRLQPRRGSLNKQVILRRMFLNHKAFQEKFESKIKKELEY